jgi:pimeloyl-ACP methyl ester carboxylesterase
VPPALVHQSVDDRGFVWLAEDDFTNHFAADVDPVTSKVMFAVQQPLASNTFGDAMGAPAWRSLPSWYLISTEDEAIPPPAQQMFAQRMGATTIEVPSSHLAMVSHPKEVVRLTEMAGEALAVNG